MAVDGDAASLEEVLSLGEDEYRNDVFRDCGVDEATGGTRGVASTRFCARRRASSSASFCCSRARSLFAAAAAIAAKDIGAEGAEDVDGGAGAGAAAGAEPLLEPLATVFVKTRGPVF